MALEIERKFLVKDNRYRIDAVSSQTIVQAYISSDKDATVRIRIINGSHGYLTIKGRNDGSVRHEWEYAIPAADAKEMIDKLPVSGLIEKTRYRCGRWEVDEFHGRHEGLVVAEIELSSADESIGLLPEWISEEVTGDIRYYNSWLASNDFV